MLWDTRLLMIHRRDRGSGYRRLEARCRAVCQNEGDSGFVALVSTGRHLSGASQDRKPQLIKEITLGLPLSASNPKILDFAGRQNLLYQPDMRASPDH